MSIWHTSWIGKELTCRFALNVNNEDSLRTTEYVESRASVRVYRCLDLAITNYVKVLVSGDIIMWMYDANPGLLRDVIIALALEHDTLETRWIRTWRIVVDLKLQFVIIFTEKIIGQDFVQTANFIANPGLKDHGALTTTCIYRVFYPRGSWSSALGRILANRSFKLLGLKIVDQPSAGICVLSAMLEANLPEDAHRLLASGRIMVAISSGRYLSESS